MVRGLLLLLALACCTAASATAAPARVVSINVCTDQLAMLVAAPGQLASVSYLARDPSASTMAEEAQAYPINHGLAEEVFGLAPDLVLAGTYTTRTTVALLRRLDIPVLELPPAESLEAVPAQLREIGEALGREAASERLARSFEAELTSLRKAAASGPRPTAALHYANGYTSGSGTLADAVVAAAGLDNAAARRGLAGTVQMPLEVLVMVAPDLVISGSRFAPPSRAEERFDHPALDFAAADSARTTVSDSRWVCGGPFTLEAVRALARIRDQLGSR